MLILCSLEQRASPISRNPRRNALDAHAMSPGRCSLHMGRVGIVMVCMAIGSYHSARCCGEAKAAMGQNLLIGAICTQHLSRSHMKITSPVGLLRFVKTKPRAKSSSNIVSMTNPVAQEKVQDQHPSPLPPTAAAGVTKCR